jgi:outer membrane protein OmpA-like peptidoglycan-associated protein
LSLDSPADDYTYFGDPTLTAIDPPTAWESKGLTVVGTNLPPQPYVTEVWFGPVGPAAAFDCISSTECAVDIPPAVGLGNFDVTVVTPQGRSNSVQFTKVPGVEQVSPSSGPAAGGTPVEITGTDFDTTLGHTIIQFDETEVEAIGCSSATRCVVVSPPGQGTAWVKAIVNGWPSAAGQPELPEWNEFTYTAGDGESTSPIPVDVRFDEDSTALRPEDEPFLRSVANALQDAPPTATVTAEGHADSSGPDDYNDALSQRRAQAVTDWLVGTGGVAADRITAVAHGEHMPIASNDDAAGRAVNRRVTITVG